MSWYLLSSTSVLLALLVVVLATIGVRRTVRRGASARRAHARLIDAGLGRLRARAAALRLAVAERVPGRGPDGRHAACRDRWISQGDARVVPD